MRFTIRTADKNDAELIADLSRETFRETFADQNTKEDMDLFLSEQFTKEGLINEVGRKGMTFFLVKEGEQVAGYVKLVTSLLPGTNEPSIEIARLYVKKEWIGQGLGKLLMNASISFAKDHQCQWLWLGVWEKNERAIAFYRAYGFEKFSETAFLLGNDMQTDWLMKKSLQSESGKIIAT